MGIQEKATATQQMLGAKRAARLLRRPIMVLPVLVVLMLAALGVLVLAQHTYLRRGMAQKPELDDDELFENSEPESPSGAL